MDFGNAIENYSSASTSISVIIMGREGEWSLTSIFRNICIFSIICVLFADFILESIHHSSYYARSRMQLFRFSAMIRDDMWI